MMDLQSVSFRYREDWVIRNLSFRVERGEFIGIVGPNGSGKSTLLKLLYRLISPQRGKILIDGIDLGAISRSEIARKMAVVAQETQLLFPFRVIEVVLMGRSPYLGHLMFESQKDLDIAKKVMAWTEVLPFADRLIDELSGGERKRVLIARALAQEPEILLLDEPTASLDIHHQIDFLNLIHSLNRERRLTIVMASHDMNLASEFCDRILLLQGGGIHSVGSPQEVITKESIQEVYGCKVWVDENPVSGMPRITLLKKEDR